ncbi:CTP synthase [Rhodanobacter sp. 7MK24]|uniref:CTP synthase C-terminal region-related (seleno)protein n=1 Tax=Rhodanobacter sp. 7MK24 TaxID=2775922 RepID=UPI001786C96E|nr:CTP synthase [Rhodanobacter sp. 7MK24]MBD8880558.1 CTP synthase [Rhodanobacter sp. 7MK24]
MPALQVGLIGDRNDGVIAHRAIPLALQKAAEACEMTVEPVWLPTDTIGDGAALAEFDGLWCVPASPYRDMDAALAAIRVARERHVPFLGTCGGFQHAVIEYARNVLGWRDAEHAETAPDAQRQVIVPLSCPLVEVTDALRLVEGSRLAKAYGVTEAAEGYHCNYGLNPEFHTALADGPLRINAVDRVGDVRGLELDDHPFFVVTLFQHERGALQDRLPPPVRAFVQAMIDTR